MVSSFTVATTVVDFPSQQTFSRLGWKRLACSVRDYLVIWAWRSVPPFPLLHCPRLLGCPETVRDYIEIHHMVDDFNSASKLPTESCKQFIDRLARPLTQWWVNSPHFFLSSRLFSFLHFSVPSLHILTLCTLFSQVIDRFIHPFDSPLSNLAGLSVYFNCKLCVCHLYFYRRIPFGIRGVLARDHMKYTV